MPEWCKQGPCIAAWFCRRRLELTSSTLPLFSARVEQLTWNQLCSGCSKPSRSRLMSAGYPERAGYSLFAFPVSWVDMAVLVVFLEVAKRVPCETSHQVNFPTPLAVTDPRRASQSSLSAQIFEKQISSRFALSSQLSTSPQRCCARKCYSNLRFRPCVKVQ